MKILFDTSVLVGAILQQHPEHEVCFEWLLQAHKEQFDWAVCSHSLLELYAVLTSYPTNPSISPGTAKRLLQENILKSAEIIEPGAEDYYSVIDNSVEQGFIGGVVYDLLIYRSAVKGGTGKLLTLNISDFSRFSELGKVEIVNPLN